MTDLQQGEQKLFDSVAEGPLKTSLRLIRQATEDIWSAEARVIRGYTDHGVAHCIRLADYAAKLLEANTGRSLSSMETYLLLASIYIHDIGMQCDVIRLPDVKVAAEKAGADFGGMTFTAATANDYSYDEQKQIRKNHSYLSVAWLSYAFHNGQGSLGRAAKTIPDKYIQDLIDICLHHTKLPIGDCGTTPLLGGEERKQFVAAVLRFSDELDVEASRVNIETVRNFQLDPENSVYWWLHHATKVTISPANVVTLTISLHPEDYETVHERVRSMFLTVFQNKNRPVLSVLTQNNLPIVINADSDVKEYEYAPKLPQDIIDSLRNVEKPREPDIELAKEVSGWLQAIRYEVPTMKRRDTRSVDIEAILDQGTVKQRVLVRCISDEVTAADVEDLDKALDRKTPQGWLISQSRVSPSALLKASEDDFREYIKVLTIKDFLKREVWAPYIDSLTSLVEREQIPDGNDLYVDLGCFKGKDSYVSLDGYIDNWLTERGKKHISLLGEFGTGKTWFCRHYAYRQLERYWQNPLGERFPLLITLRTFAKTMTAQQLISDALLVQYRLPFVGNPYEIFQELNRNGKLLLILDGFDEMARQVDQQTVIDNFWELATLVGEDSKVILTSRTEYFRQGKESESIFGGLELGRRKLRLEPPKFEEVNLQQLTDAQIKRLIIGRLKREKGHVEAERVANRILAIQTLAEMARKPILVELLLAALDEVSPDVLQKPAQVYLYATNKLLLRNIETNRTFTTTADKLLFLCELAWEMIVGGDLRIHYKDIPTRITAHFKDRIQDKHELDHWDFDLRNQTMLHRDAAGYYEFAHKSLAEYFVALKFAAEIGCLPRVFTQTYVELDGKPCNFPIQETDDWDKLRFTFGRQSLLIRKMVAVYQLLQEMISLAPQAEDKLLNMVRKTRVQRGIEVMIIGGNAFNLLRHVRTSFVDMDFSQIRLSTVDFDGLDFSGANFSQSRLSEFFVNDVNFAGANFDLATLDPIGNRNPNANFQRVRLATTNVKPNQLGLFKGGGAILSRVQEETLLSLKPKQAHPSKPEPPPE